MGKTSEEEVSLDALETGLNFDEVSFFNEELPTVTNTPTNTVDKPKAEIPLTDPEEVAIVDEEEEDEIKASTPIKEEPITKAKEEPVTQTVNLGVIGEVLADKIGINFNKEDFDKAEDKDEYLITSVAERITDGIEEYKQTLPKEIQELVDLHEQGVPLYTALQADAIIDYYEKLDKTELKENISLQKDLVKDLLVKKGYSEEKADKKVKSYETTGILETEAEDALDTLVDLSKEEKVQKIEADKKAAIQNEASREAQRDAIRKTIKDTKEIIPTLEYSTAQRKMIEDAILRVDKDGMNKIMRVKKQNPMFDLQVATIAAIYDGDFTKFAEAMKTKAVTKATRTLKEAIDTDNNPMGRGPGGTLREAEVNVDLMKKVMRNLKRSNK